MVDEVCVMRVSTKGRYGLRVMIELAIRQGEGPILVQDLASAQDLPPKYLHVLLGTLRATGLVNATRGPNGGYALAKDAARITALEVVEALEGRMALSACAEEEGGTCCARGRTCSAKELWDEASLALTSVLGSRTLAMLAERERQLRAQDPADHYSI